MQLYGALNPHHGTASQLRGKEHRQPVGAKLMVVSDGCHSDYFPVDQFNPILFLKDTCCYHVQIFVHVEQTSAGQYGSLLPISNNSCRDEDITFFECKRTQGRE